jgi:hypothetical protein
MDRVSFGSTRYTCSGKLPASFIRGTSCAVRGGTLIAVPHAASGRTRPRRTRIARYQRKGRGGEDEIL